MKKIERLREKLTNVAEEIEKRGCNLTEDSPYYYDSIDLAYNHLKRCTEGFMKSDFDTLTDYDIYESLIAGTSIKDVINEICEAMAKHLKEEDEAIKYYECDFEYDKPEKGTYSICIKAKRKPSKEEVEEFCKKDMENLGLVKCTDVLGPISHDEAVAFYDMENESEFPVFEDKCSDSEDCKKESCELKEGTSNFPVGGDFDLLVFYTYDEFYNKMKQDSDYPNEEQFTTEAEDGDLHFDEKAYEEAKEEFEEKYWDENDICVLDEDDVERLEDKLYDFNQETKSLASQRIDAGDEKSYDDSDYLEDVEIRIGHGYYEAQYIEIEHENYLDQLSEKFGEEQKERIRKFIAELKEEFNLTKLGLAYGPASNGETGFKIITDSLKESAGWIAMYNGKKLDIVKGRDANDLWGAKQFAIKHFNIPKSRQSQLAIDVAFDDDDDGNGTSNAQFEAKGKEKRKVHARIGGDPEKTITFLNHAMNTGTAPTSAITEDAKKDANELFGDFLEYVEFQLVKYPDGMRKSKSSWDGTEHDGVWGLKDYQGANLGDIESDRFTSAKDIADRLGIYINDYLLQDEKWGEFDSVEDALEKAPNHPLHDFLDLLANRLGEVDLEKVPHEVADDQYKGSECFALHFIGPDGKEIKTLGKPYALNCEKALADKLVAVMNKYPGRAGMKHEVERLPYCDTQNYKVLSRDDVEEWAMKIEAEGKAVDGTDESMKHGMTEKWNSETFIDRVAGILDDYGILYGDLVDNDGESVNIVGVDESEWPEVADAIRAELGTEAIIPDKGHEELDDEIIVLNEGINEIYNARGMAYYEYPKGSKCHVRETPTSYVAVDAHGSNIGEAPTKSGAEAIIDNHLKGLKEASSAEKNAYRGLGDNAYADLVDGRAIAMIKDPDERARAIASKKLANKGRMDNRPTVDKEYPRKVAQADRAVQKKQAKMFAKGMK